MGDIAILGLLLALLLVQLWRMRLDRQRCEEAERDAAVLAERQGLFATALVERVEAQLAHVNERLAGLIEIEERKAHARAQLRTLVKGDGRTLLRERLKAHLGG